jgi:O-antigen ligase
MEMSLIALTLLFAMIAWMRLSWAVLLLMASLPAYLLRGEFFGIPTTLLELIIIVVVVIWLIQNRHHWRELFRIDRRWAVVIALFVLSATISAIIASDTMSAFGIWKAYFIEPILLFYIIINLLRRNQITAENVVKSLMTGGVVVALFAIVQWITRMGIPIPWDFERRVTGVFDYPNALGLYLGPLTILAFGKYISLTSRPSPAQAERAEGSQNSSRSFDSRWSLGITFSLFLFAILLAQSEAALGAIVLTVIVMGLLRSTWRKKTAVVVIVFAIILLVIPTTRSYVFEKMTLQDDSGQVRIGQWSETWKLIKDHSVLGVGLSGYPTAFIPYHQQTHIEIFQYPHNIFLNIWVELGLLGLIAFGLLCYQILLSLRAWSDDQTRQSQLRLLRSLTLPRNDMCLALFPLLTMFLHGLVDVSYFKNDLAVLTWVLIALIYVSQTSHPKIQR